MSVGSKFYDAYMRQARTAIRRRNKSAIRRNCGKASICPFTLEAIKDCVMRKKTPRSVCLFSLEDCPGQR